jgi:hypothetical protein
MTNGKKVNPNDKKPVAGGQPVPAPQIDTAGLVELASKLTEYYGGGAGKGYRVERRKNPDGSMELVIAPVSGDKRTFTITYGGQPDERGFVSGTLKVDDNNTVPVRFHPKLGRNYMTEADAKKFAEFLATGGSGKGNGAGEPTGEKKEGGEGPQSPTFSLFNPFQQPELANPNPATGNTPTERTPGFWDKLSDSLVSSLPFLITMLLMSSNRSED